MNFPIEAEPNTVDSSNLKMNKIPSQIDKKSSELMLAGDLDDKTFLENLYREILHREIDSAGLQGKIWSLKRGKSRFDILKEMISSEEFLKRIKNSTCSPKPRANLVALKPDRFYREGEFLVFKVNCDQDYDWLESQIQKNNYYDSLGTWGYEINFDKKLMAEFLSVFGNVRGLDIGCGVGTILETLRQKNINYDGLEISQFSIKRSFPLIQENIIQGDLLTAHFNSKTYKVVCGLDIFEHFNPNKFGQYIVAIKNILAGNGFLIVNSPAFGKDDIFGTVHTYWLEDWKSSAVGAQIFKSIPVDEMGYPLMGHLIWAEPNWWESTFAEYGMERNRSLELLLHELFDEAMTLTPYRKGFFIFQFKNQSREYERLVIDNIKKYDKKTIIRIMDEFT